MYNAQPGGCIRQGAPSANSAGGDPNRFQRNEMSALLRRGAGRISIATSTAVLVAAVLSGCAGAPSVSHRQRSDDSWNLASSLMGSSGPLLVEVRGNPFGVPEAQLADAVITEMKRAITWSGGARFTTDPAAAGSQDMRVVWMFNGGPGGKPQCRGEGAGGGPESGGAVRINAVFCDDDYVISDVSGSVAATGGLADPVFAQLTRQVTLELFPNQRPDRGRGPVLLP